MLTAMIGMMLGLASQQAADPGREEAMRRLGAQKVEVDFQDVKLEEAIGFLRDVTGLNIVLQPSALVRVGEAKVRLKARDLSAKSVLRLLLSGRDLMASYRDGALVIHSSEEAHDGMTLRMYDVRALAGALQDFPGPRMELTSPKAKGGTPLSGVAVFVLDEPRQTLPADFLVELVKTNTGGESWNKSGAEIRHANGMLVVNQTTQTHREIERLLGLIGQFK